MKNEPGLIVIAATWDDKVRPAIFIEKRGADCVLLPFTSDRHVVRHGKPAHVWEWREIGLHRESWLWNFLQRCPCSEISEPEGPSLYVTPSLARRVAGIFGEQMRPDTRSTFEAFERKTA